MPRRTFATRDNPFENPRKLHPPMLDMFYLQLSDRATAGNCQFHIENIEKDRLLERHIRKFAQQYFGARHSRRRILLVRVLPLESISRMFHWVVGRLHYRLLVMYVQGWDTRYSSQIWWVGDWWMRWWRRWEVRGYCHCSFYCGLLLVASCQHLSVVEEIVSDDCSCSPSISALTNDQSLGVLLWCISYDNDTKVWR